MCNRIAWAPGTCRSVKKVGSGYAGFNGEAQDSIAVILGRSDSPSQDPGLGLQRCDLLLVTVLLDDIHANRFGRRRRRCPTI